MPLPAPCLVVAWTERDGVEPTGRTVVRDGVLRPEVRVVPRARALVWSRDPADWGAGRAWAAREGYRAMVLPDTGDVLARARDAVLAQAGAP